MNPPIVLSSTFRGTGTPGAGERVYGRFTNPTWDPLEQAIGQLECSELPALIYGSGMAAVASAFSLLPAGGTLVVPRHAYNGSLALAADLKDRYGMVVREAALEDTAATIALLDGADMIWLESPTNPMLEVADLPALIGAGIRTCCSAPW